MPRVKQSRAFLLVSLLALSLLGGQALKDAPWHDHSHHVADCATCHLQFAGEAVPAGTPPAAAGEGRVILHSEVPDFSVSPLFTHYQGRAPPLPLQFG